MREDRDGEAAHVIGAHEGAAVEGGTGAGGFDQAQGAAGAAAYVGVRVVAGRGDDTGNVVENRRVDVDVFAGVLHAQQVLGVGYLLHVEVVFAAADAAAGDFGLVFGAGVADAEAHEEAVHLGFGQRVGPFLFDGVLGRHDHEGFAEFVGAALDADLALLHGFEHGGLGLGRCAVDLVAEQEVAEDRAGAEREFGRVLVKDVAAGDVAGKHVGRELDALEVAAAGERERIGHHRFGETWEILEQDVALGKDVDHDQSHDLFFAHDDLADLFQEAIARVANMGDRLVEAVCRAAVSRPLFEDRLGHLQPHPLPHHTATWLRPVCPRNISSA